MVNEIGKNVKKRETTSIYEVDGRRFEINAFDPMEGMYILTQVLSFILPLGITNSLKSQIKGSEKVLNETVSNNKMMPKADFINLQIDVLKSVYELYDTTGQKSPVVRDNGTYGVSNVTIGLIAQLLIATLAFNFADFFDESLSVEHLLDL